MPNIELTWQGIKECEVFWFESTPICMHPREKSLNFHNLDSKTVGLNYDVGLQNEQAKLTIKSSLNEVCYYEVLFRSPSSMAISWSYVRPNFAFCEKRLHTPFLVCIFFVQFP